MSIVYDFISSEKFTFFKIYYYLRMNRNIFHIGFYFGFLLKQMADMSGLDVFVHVGKSINEAYGERCYNSPITGLLFDAKRFGEKTGSGYYKHAKGGKPAPDATLQPFLDQCM